MKYHKQLYYHQPWAGRYGDCFRTVLACLLDLESPEAVPHFYEWGRDFEDGHLLMRKWLRTRGMQPIEIPLDCDLEDVFTFGKRYWSGIHYWLLGESKTGVGHTVVCKDDKIVHDPSLNDAGIVDRVAGFYWIGFLARRT